MPARATPHICGAILAAIALSASSGRTEPRASTVQASFAPADTLPFDPAVTTGTLPSGLNYYIRRNAQPAKRVNLQLAVKAGSIDEADDQQGLAHVIEHMAFSGSRHFKPGDLISTFAAAGARPGPHVNAHTGFDNTVYSFTLPTDGDGIVLKGIQALSDVAGGLSLDSEAIETARRVVIDEWRSSADAGSQSRDQQLPVLYYKSKYAERSPIGRLDVLRTFTPDRLRAFYGKWYRPDRMAVVVVGDIDTAQIASMIRREFGAIEKPGTRAPARAYEVPLQSAVLVKVIADPGAARSLVSLVRKKRRLGSERVADYRRDLVDGLVLQMINDRFDDLSQRADPPFLEAGAYENALSPTVGTVVLTAAVEEGQLGAGLAALEIETNRVKQYGFGIAELDRARTTMLASYERAYSERGKVESDSYAQEYVAHFIEAEPSPGVEYERRLASFLIPRITSSDATAEARRLFADDSRVVLATLAQKPDATLPGESQLRDALNDADAVPVTKWIDVARASVLMARVPDAAAVIATRVHPELGVTIVRFANGVDAWLKPTDFTQDRVLFSLTASGGTSVAPAALYPEARLATSQVELSGVGGHNALELQKLLAGTVASARPFATDSMHGISGSSSTADLETALQLLNLTFTAPGDTPQAFTRIRKQLEAAYAKRGDDPRSLFSEQVAQVNTSGHYTSQTLTRERIEALDRAAMMSFYTSSFSNAADFAFFMTGAFTVADAVPLLARYVGSLPSTGKRTSHFQDLRLTFPSGTKRIIVATGREPHAEAVLSFFAEPPIDEDEQTRLEGATMLLEIVLRDGLRQELGRTYSLSVRLVQPLPQRGGGHVSVSFGGAPAAIGPMTDRVLREVERMQQEGPPADLVARVAESTRREHEIALRQNGFWLGRLQSAWLLDRDPVLMLHREDRIDAVTRDGLREMFRAYFPLDRYTILTFLPAR